MIVKLLTEHNLEFLSLNGGCRGSCESTLVKMSNCWKSHAAAHLSLQCRVLWSSLIVVDKKCIVVSEFFCHIYLYLERTHVYNTCGHNILMGVDLHVSSLSSSPN